jgi:vacuolar-type H+-ATPase subunit E/Vma4
MEVLSDTNKKLNDLRSAILLDAKQRADKITREANATMVEVERNLEQKRSFLQGKWLEEISDALSKEIIDVKTELARDVASTILQFKQDMLDKAINDVRNRFYQKMVDDPDHYYRTYLAKLIAETLALVSFKEYYLTLNPRDARYVKDHDFLKQFGKKIIVRDEHFPEDDMGYIVGDKSGSIAIDQRLSKKLEENERYLKTKLSPILFSE